MTDNFQSVKNILLVLSGKGGVGKSSVTTQLALSLSLQGFKVGILDIDLTGPSIPRIFQAEDSKIVQSHHGWIPVSSTNGIKLISIGFLIKDRGDSIVWRGAKKSAMIKQFITDVNWGELDYLIIDTPPGTSDEHISIVEELSAYREKIIGGVIVTTPQLISLEDVRKEINFCKLVKLEIIGIVENMNGFVCPHCKECTNIFSSKGGEILAKELSLKYLGRLPIDPKYNELVESGKLAKYQDSEIYNEYFKIIMEQIDVRSISKE
ncbi:hypothetical protein WICPIJ_001837 [Wickerhamomyces pijperi]|uniref:Cytosolic Fe-S cluster assembly factor CFD1 n=1 Tax=Wickerhamomyces pijperi TaxID=599730 RepID=A0A9P8QAU8_WICPI|nr:hypothetical protein WICPIJ_001837 [Wickerhamomyces pijperi]